MKFKKPLNTDKNGEVITELNDCMWIGFSEPRLKHTCDLYCSKKKTIKKRYKIDTKIRAHILKKPSLLKATPS